MFGSLNDEQLEKLRALLDRSKINDPGLLAEFLLHMFKFNVQDELERRKQHGEAG